MLLMIGGAIVFGRYIIEFLLIIFYVYICIVVIMINSP